MATALVTHDWAVHTELLIPQPVSLHALQYCMPGHLQASYYIYVYL